MHALRGINLISAGIMLRRFYSSGVNDLSGLFGITGLRAPEDFIRMGCNVKSRCEDILQRIAKAQPNAHVVRLMDDLSDEV